MKSFILGFARRGMTAASIGPIVLGILYLILQRVSTLETLQVSEVCVGIFSITALAFVAGGMNAVYQIERLPLMAAILIHGSVLYISYLATYLLNGWLEQGAIALIVFSAIFVVGFILIWASIYVIMRKSTARVNALLSEKQTLLPSRKGAEHTRF